MADLECATHAEDTVVGLLGRETLKGEEDNVGLFRDEIVGSVGHKTMSADCAEWHWHVQWLQWLQLLLRRAL